MNGNVCDLTISPHDPTMPGLEDGQQGPLYEEDSDDGDDSDWEEDEMCEASNDYVSCLFCHETFRLSKLAFDHCSEYHLFNIGKLKSELSLDYFSYIRLINYLRLKNLNSFSDVCESELRAALTDDKYMKPTQNDDLLLMFDIDELPTCIVDSNEIRPPNVVEYGSSDRNLLLEKLALAEERLNYAHEVIQQMKLLALGRLEGEPDLQCSKCARDLTGTVVQEEDDGYFSTYAHFGIHHEMLQDKVRTVAYRDAILLNPDTFGGRHVLDVGCGTGILSMFAAKSGAKTVVGVDQSEIIYQAMDIVRDNGLDGVITLMRGRVEDLQLEPADVIVSEWMGYFLLFESMLDSVIYARDRYLKPGGVLLPNRCTLHIAGLSDNEGHQRLIGCWDDVYGFRMNCLKGEVVREASIETVSPESLITESVILQEFDLLTCKTTDLQFVSEFSLLPTRSGPLTALVGWFDTFFDAHVQSKVYFSTSPREVSTHWKQTVYYFLRPIALTEGVTVHGKVECSRLANDLRSLKVAFTINGQRSSYFLR